MGDPRGRPVRSHPLQPARTPQLTAEGGLGPPSSPAKSALEYGEWSRRGVRRYNARVGDFDALYRRAGVLARQGRYPDAEVAYRQAVEMRPDDVKARLDLALVLRRQRRSADAESVLRD